jgi:hypothetical protein
MDFVKNEATWDAKQNIKVYLAAITSFFFKQGYFGQEVT